MELKIKDEVLKLHIKYREEYEQWCKDNHGKIMHGALIKTDTLDKLSFAESLNDLNCMLRYYEIAQKSTNTMNGFKFSIEVTQELINNLENK
jgi:hypothetical protein